MEIRQILDELNKPFHPSRVAWKPGAVKGERALAMPYADMRVYMDRLDEVCGGEWSVSYDPWGADRIICRLTIAGVTRSSTGESSAESDRNEIGGTVAEAQAMKRACVMFGLGRYLYNLPTVWADFDPKTKQFTDGAKARLTNALVVHYRRVTADEPQQGKPQPDAQAQDSDRCDELNTLGADLYGASWPDVRERNIHRISGGKVTDCAQLTAEQVGKLIDGMNKVKAKRPQRPATPATKPTAQTAQPADDKLFDEKTAHPPAANGGKAHVTQTRLNRLHDVGTEAYGKEWDAKRHQLVEMISKGAITSSRDLTPAEAENLITGIEKKLAESKQPA